MKKLSTLLTTALCLGAVFAMMLPAHALTCNIGAPGDPAYGKPTSFEPVVTADGGAIKNEDASKNAALIPPGFGTPTSYLSGSGEYLTPNLVPSQKVGTGAVNGSTVTVIPPTGTSGAGDFQVSTQPPSALLPGVGPNAGTPAPGFTAVTSAMYYANGSLGTLRIPSIGLTVGVYEGTGSAPLLKGAGHFEGTSIWLGNVCIAGHNRGVRNDFGKIHTLKSGTLITFTTKLGTCTYAVTGVNKVSVNDVSGLSPSSANMITLYTCVENQPAYRWCVTAVQV